MPKRVSTLLKSTTTHLRTVTNLDLSDQSITSLKSGDFSGLTALTNLNLDNNKLHSLPGGIFTGLTALKTLNLDGNAIEPFPITVSLQKVAESKFKVMVPTGALFDIVLPINVTNGKIIGGATQVIIPKGSVQSRTFTVYRTPDERAAVTVEIGTLPECPVGYSGCVLSKSEEHSLEIVKRINTAPMFKEGWLTTRVVMDSKSVGVPLGKPIKAIDLDGDPITYTLNGIDVNAFTLDREGFLKTRVPLYRSDKSIYSVTVTASDVIDSTVLTVVITLADVNSILPGFIPVSERTPQVRHAIVSAIPEVHDAEDVTLTHLAKIKNLNLRGKSILELKSGDFSGLIALTNLNLYGNQLSTLPDGIFNGLTALKSLRLGRNAVDEMILPVYLQQVGDDQYKAVVPTGAPFDIILPVSVTNGIISDGVTPLRISQGSMQSEVFGVACPLGSPVSPGVSLKAIPKLPRNHFGYTLAQSTVYNRTPQVTKAITAAVPGITDPRYVTDLHLVTITELNLNNVSITSLKTGDFAGLLALNSLYLNNNKLTSLPDDIFDSLMSLTHLDLSGNEFTYLSARTFDELPYLSSLHLGTNKLTSLSQGMFENITGLERLHLDGNLVDPLPLWVTLEKVGDDQFKVVVPAGAPFPITLPITIQNGRLANRATTITVWAGAVESTPFTVTRAVNTVDAVTVTIGTLPNQPEFHTGYVLAKSDTLRLEIINAINIPPVFREGNSAVRTVAENTPADINIGDPITATDVNKDDRLEYSLGGIDAAAFDIDRRTGQLKTKVALDYETKPIYNVIVNVSDGNADHVSITVTVNVSNINEMPVFTEGSSTTRSIPENTDSGANIGNPIAATDPEGDTLTYSLSGTNANAFTIDSKTGQLMTKNSLDYEVKPTYTVIVKASDENGGNASIAVTINILDINEPKESDKNNVPVFTEGSSTTRSIPENTAVGVNIGSAVSATDADGDKLTYRLSGTDADAFIIDTSTGHLKTSAALDYETKSIYNVTITAVDGKGGIASIAVTVNVTNENEVPVFTEGSSTTRSIPENTARRSDIGSAVTATDPDGDTLTYNLSGTDANAFIIDSSSGHLKTNTALDYETKPSYTITITADDGKGGSAAISVTINITDVEPETSKSVNVPNSPPVFAEGSNTTRSVAENTASGINIGAPVTATDPDGDIITYTLGGTDPNAFNFIIGTGQLQTKAELDYETKSTYSVTIVALDGRHSTLIDVTVNVTNVNDNAPVFTDGSSTTRSIVENTESGVNIGKPVSATDADGDTLTYSLGGNDAVKFSLDNSTGQLQTKSALDYETKNSYTITITADDGKGGSASINVTINITDVEPERSKSINVQNRAPVFTEGSTTTRSVDENTASGVNIGKPVSATDADGDTLTYSLGGTDAASFSIDSSTGQLQTKTALDYETKNRFSVVVGTTDGKNNSRYIAVTVNVTNLNDNLPVFTDEGSATRSIPENTASGTNIGAPVSATDADGDALRYSLSGDDASAFSINRTTGQLRTRAALDYETKSIYNITVRATDDQTQIPISVTVNVTNVNEAPVFTEGSSTTRRVSKNRLGSGLNIGDPITATDPEGDTITYTHSGTDSSNFTIDSNTGQLKTASQVITLSSLNKETFSVTITASDSVSTNTISVTIKFNNLPVFTEGRSTSRSIAENTVSGTNIGNPVTATDADGDTLTYSLGGTDAASFSIDSNTGQLQTNAALDYETKNSYTVAVAASDGFFIRPYITVTIDVTNVNEAPVFSDGSSTTRKVSRKIGFSVNVGDPFTATDPEGDTVTYSHSGNDSSNFTIDSNTGQLKTAPNTVSLSLASLNKATFSVTITASDSVNTNTISVTIKFNNPPLFGTTISQKRSIPENTAIGTNIGAPITATDADGDTLTYRFSAEVAITNAFTIDSNTGQLKTKAALDYENSLIAGETWTSTYGGVIYVFDGIDHAYIGVSISVTDVDEPPVFNKGYSTTLSVSIDAGTGVNIGDPFTATDPEGDKVTYLLGTNLHSKLVLDRNTGQLRTGANFYKGITVNLGDTFSFKIIAHANQKSTPFIDITVNVVSFPVFSEGSSTTRSIAERTVSGVNIGKPVAATDADGDTLTYSLGGTDAAAFSLNSSTGQLQTLAVFDYETKKSYTVTITATDEDDYSASITVTVNVTNVNEAPIFKEGSSATRSIAENSAANTNIGNPITATDPEGGNVTYTMDSTLPKTSPFYSPDLFSIVSRFLINNNSGQLQTNRVALDYETKSSYTFLVKASDGNNSSSITLTVNVTDVAEAPTVQQSPTKTALLANYPNPFNPETWIPYQLSKSTKVTLTIYNVKGETVRQFTLGLQVAGDYLSRNRAIHWDGKNQSGEKVSTGVYFYRFTAGNYSATRRMLIIK